MCDMRDERLGDPTPQARLAPDLLAPFYSAAITPTCVDVHDTAPARPLSRPLQPRAQGRHTRPSAKRSEIRCTRGAFRR
jgi:hypothetical protein